MELSECCEKVLQAALQSQNNKSRLPHLLHQLEDLANCTKKVAKVSQLISCTDHLKLVDCLTFLASIIQENEGMLLERVLKVLLNLSHDETIRKMLHDTFNLCPSLATLVQTRSYKPEDQALFDALCLLQKLTYGHRIRYDQSYVDGLLKLLISNVLSKVDSVIEPSLGILANLCRNNNLIQLAIRNMPQFRKFLKCLCGYFENENFSLVIFSLTIFISLTIQDREGQEFILENRNFERILQAIFIILRNGFRSEKWKYAADLLTDFTRNLQLRSCIVRYRCLKSCINEVLSLIATHTDEGIAEVFQLLLCICTVPSIRKMINDHLFSPLVQGSFASQFLKDLSPQALNPESEPLLYCLHWAHYDSVHSTQTSDLALEFLSDSVQECLYDPDNPYPVHSLIPVLASLMSKTATVSIQISEKTFMSLSQKIIQLTKLLKVMCSDAHCKAVFSQDGQVSTETFCALMEIHLSNKNLSKGLALSRIQSEKNLRDISAHCVLHLLDLALILREQVTGLSQYVSTVLRDPRLFPFLSQGLSSCDHSIVGIALHLICFDLGSTTIQPDVDLCETIACLNKEKANTNQPSTVSPQQENSAIISFRQQPDEDKENRRVPFSSSTPISHAFSSNSVSCDSRLQQDETSLQSLIDRLESSIENKDVKTADVLGFFDHKLKAQQIKEEHLNDLLDAKSQALTQADRLIARFRGDQAAHNAEISKLQHCLRELERRNEKMVSQMNDMRISAEKLQAQFEKQLEEKAGNIELLQKENGELLEKTSELEANIIACEQKIKSISQMKDDLQVAHEKLNEQYRVSCSQSQQLDEERKALSKVLKEKDSTLQKLTTNLESLQEKFKCVDKEKTELEKEKEEVEISVENLRVALTASEKECKKLQQSATLLDKVNQEQSIKLNEKTKRIQDLEAELEKHSQIVSFINNLNLKK